MGWRKLLKPGPINLGTQHLDTIMAPDVYVQPFASRATNSNGYPWDGIAGTLEVLPWNPTAGNVIAVFTSWDRGIAKRVYHNGVWREWLDAMGTVIS